MSAPSPPRIFDTGRVASRLARSRHLATRPDAARWLRAAMTDDLVERIAFMRLAPERALVIDEDHGIGNAIEQRGADVVRADPIALDLERPYPSKDLDLIVSVAALDTVNDLPGALIHQRNALRPGGVMMAAMVGAGSLPRLRTALLAADGDRPAARIHPAVDARSGAGLLQRAGYARQVADSWTLKVSYRSLDALVADLRAQALTSVLADAPPALTRAGLARARAKFLDGADADGRVIETLEILTLTGWRD